MKDYAAELAERWFKKIDETTNMSGAIEGAIREALAKAADIVSTSESVHEAWERVRALGAKR